MLGKVGEAVYYCFYLFCVGLFAVAGFTAILYLVWLFVSVIFLGESSACPQNLC